MLTHTRVQQNTFRLLLGLVIGNILEWYGFSLFVQLDPIFRQYFPQLTRGQEILLNIGLFAAGFLLRPLGGILLSHYGDKKGRLNTLVTSVSLILLPTFIIGLLPTYATIGIFASISLIILRLLQGFSAGGEMPGSMVFAVEQAAPLQRGLLGSVPLAAASAGMFASSLVIDLLNHLLTANQIINGGWRLPFLLAGVFAVIGYYIRKGLTETEPFLNLKESGKILAQPVKYAVKQQSPSLLLGIGITAVSSGAIYLLLIYMQTYLQRVIQIADEQALAITGLGLLSTAILVPVMGWLSDKLGRRPVMICGILGLIIDAYPLYVLLMQKIFYYTVLAEILIGVLCACVLGPLPAMLAELFPAKNRFSGLGLSYNLAFTLFGGLAPAVSLVLLHLTGATTSPGLYIIVIGIISLISVYKAPETYRRPLIQ